MRLVFFSENSELIASLTYRRLLPYYIIDNALDCVDIKYSWMRLKVLIKK